MKNELWSLKYEVWGMKYEAWSEKYEVRSVKYELWSMNCDVWSENCQVCSENCEVWTVKCEVWTVKYEVRTVKCEVRTVKYELWTWHIWSKFDWANNLRKNELWIGTFRYLPCIELRILNYELWSMKSEVLTVKCNHRRTWSLRKFAPGYGPGNRTLVLAFIPFPRTVTQIFMLVQNESRKHIQLFNNNGNNDNHRQLHLLGIGLGIRLQVI